MHSLPQLRRETRQRLRELVTGVAAGSALAFMATATPAAAASESKAEAEICMLGGVTVPKEPDTACATDVLSTLRAYYYEYEAPKMGDDGAPVVDPETGEVVMEVRRETFGLMATLLEAGGLGGALTSVPGTVFALPDSVLAPVANAIAEAMKDEAMRDEIAAQIAAAVGSHALNEPMAKSAFRNANGKVWTLAGGWQTAAPPLSFYALSGDGSVKVNGVMLDRTVTAPDGSVIHIIASPLVALPQPAMEMAEKSG